MVKYNNLKVLWFYSYVIVEKDLKDVFEIVCGKIICDEFCFGICYLYYYMFVGDMFGD